MSRFIEYSNNIFFDVMLTVWRNVERRDKDALNYVHPFLRCIKELLHLSNYLYPQQKSEMKKINAVRLLL